MMQATEFYRRGVVRPLDDSAAKQLSEFKIASSIRTEWIPVLSDDDFGDLWEAGVFQRINEVCGSAIADYEEVELDVKQLASALNVIRETKKLNGNNALFFKGLEGMIVDAIDAQTNVYFIF